METFKFRRKSFEVEAVRVTDENIAEVAKWCDGRIVEENGKKFIKVRVANVINERQTQALVGDWVLYAGTGYKVYTPKAFSKSFERVETERPQELRTVTADNQGVRVG